MKIIAEENEIEMDLPRENVCLKDVVEEVEDFLLSIGRVPTALSIDGAALSQDELDSRLDSEMSGEEVLEFGTITLEKFVVESLEGASDANRELVNQLQRFAEELQSPEGAPNSTRIVADLNQFFDFWIRLYQLVPLVFETVTFDGKNLMDYLNGLRSLLEEVIGALESADVVLAMDLLRYEVCPAIEAVDAGIPQAVEAVGRIARESEKTEATEEA